MPTRSSPLSSLTTDVGSTSENGAERAQGVRGRARHDGDDDIAIKSEAIKSEMGGNRQDGRHGRVQDGEAVQSPSSSHRRSSRVRENYFLTGFYKCERIAIAEAIMIRPLFQDMSHAFKTSKAQWS